MTEASIARYAAAREFPIIPCTLCGSQTHMQRLVVKNMLREWEQKFPGRVEAIFSSICNVAASQLADPALFDFAGLDGPGRQYQLRRTDIRRCRTLDGRPSPDRALR